MDESILIGTKVKYLETFVVRLKILIVQGPIEARPPVQNLYFFFLFSSSRRSTSLPTAAAADNQHSQLPNLLRIGLSSQEISVVVPSVPYPITIKLSSDTKFPIKSIFCQTDLFAD